MKPKATTKEEITVMVNPRAGIAEVMAYNPAPGATSPVAAEYGGNNGKELTIPVGEGQSAKSVKLWTWGLNNLLPNEREALLMENNLVSELIATKMALVQGSGRYYFRRTRVEGKEVIEEVDPPKWWLDLERRTKAEIHMDFNELFDMVFKNLFIHANAPVEFRRNREGKLYAIEAWECINSRSGKQNAEGYVEDWYWCGNWRLRNSKKTEFPVMWSPAYNFSDYHEESSLKPKPAAQAKFVRHIYDPLLFDGYYGIPGYWGGRKWISAQNKIPVFHDSNIDDGYFLKMQVEFPKDYFTDYTAFAQAQNETAKNAVRDKESEARSNFLKKMNDLFSGAAGNKIVFTEYEINKQMGKDYPGVKIKVLETNKLDESMLKLFDKGNEAVISGQGIPAVLASIQTPGRLGSGSEALNLFNIYITVKAPRYRRMVAKIFETARQIEDPNSDIEMGFRDIELATLDVAPTGMVEPTNDPNNPSN